MTLAIPQSQPGERKLHSSVHHSTPLALNTRPGMSDLGHDASSRRLDRGMANRRAELDIEGPDHGCFCLAMRAALT